MKKLLTLKNLFLIILVFILTEKKDVRCNIIKENNIKNDEDKRFHLFYYSHNFFKTLETKQKKKKKKKQLFKNVGISNLSKEISIRKETYVTTKHRTCPFDKEESSFEMGSRNITCYDPIIWKKERKCMNKTVIKKNVINDQFVYSDIDKEYKNDIKNVEEKIDRDIYEKKDYENNDNLVVGYDDNFLLSFLKKCLMKIFSSPKKKKTVVQKKHKSNFFINSSLKYIYMYLTPSDSFNLVRRKRNVEEEERYTIDVGEIELEEEEEEVEKEEEEQVEDEIELEEEEEVEEEEDEEEEEEYEEEYDDYVYEQSVDETEESLQQLQEEQQKEVAVEDSEESSNDVGEDYVEGEDEDMIRVDGYYEDQFRDTYDSKIKDEGEDDAVDEYLDEYSDVHSDEYSDVHSDEYSDVHSDVYSDVYSDEYEKERENQGETYSVDDDEGEESFTYEKSDISKTDLFKFIEDSEGDDIYKVDSSNVLFEDGTRVSKVSRKSADVEGREEEEEEEEREEREGEEGEEESVIKIITNVLQNNVLPSDGADEFDKIDLSFETTESGDTSVSEDSFDKYASNNTNKEYVCDFTDQLKPTESTPKVKKCELKVNEPLIKVKIICPLKGSVEKIYDNIEYVPKKSPYVVLTKEETKLKEHVLSKLIYGLIISPTVNEKENNFKEGVIEFTLPPMVNKPTVFYFICDNSKTEDENKKGNRGIVEVSIQPYGNKINGCAFLDDDEEEEKYGDQGEVDENNDKIKLKKFFTQNIYKKNNIYPCYMKLYSGDIGGIMFPKNIKSSTCFEEMIPYNKEIKWNKEKKTLTNLINNSVVYNKDMNAKYYNVQYVHIPTSYKDTLNLFCSIILKEDESNLNLNSNSYLVYVSINEEFNFSLLDFYESFVPIKKTIQAAQRNLNNKEHDYTCDFTDKLDKPVPPLIEGKKLFICRKYLKEFDTFTLKCNVNKTNYPNIEIFPKNLKDKKEVLKLDLDIQYQMFSKFFKFNTQNSKYLNLYPSYLMFPFNHIGKKELKNNPIYKSHKDIKYFEQSSLLSPLSSSDSLGKLLNFIDTQETVSLTEKIRYLNITINELESDNNTFSLTLQVPPYIDIKEPFYFMFGCNNNKGDGNIGVVELLISKHEEIIKGCNFHDTKLDYFNNNVSSSKDECTLHAYENDIIGFNCSETNNASDEEEDGVDVSLQPENCFNKVYKGLEIIDINTLLNNAQVYKINNKKTPVFLKIPPYNLLEDTKLSCKCTIEGVVKNINVILTKTDTVLLKREIQNEYILDDKIYTCEHENFINPRVNRIFDENVEHTCNVKIEKFFNYIQILCPAKDLGIYKDIQMYYDIIKPTRVPQFKKFNNEELHKLIPNSEMLHKTKEMLILYNEEKVDLLHFYVFFPIYIKDNYEFNIVCDNSKTTWNNQIGGKVIYHITVSKREQKVKGCSFNDEHTNMFIDNKSNVKNCVIDANPKDIIGFVCPSGTLKITSCFKDAVVNTNLTNINRILYLKNNLANFTYKHYFNYMEVPALMDYDISFKCICVDLKKKKYNIKSPLGPKVLNAIYKKLNIRYDKYVTGTLQNKYLMTYMDLHLSNKRNYIKELFNDLDKKKPADTDANPETIIESLTINESNESTPFPTGDVDAEHLLLEGYDVWENLYDETLEDVIYKDIESLELKDIEQYVLQVNLKAPKLMMSSQINNNRHVCDFSMKNLIVPDSLKKKKEEGGNNPINIHCYALLKPLDTLYVKCPTSKDNYEAAKVNISESDNEYELQVISLIEKRLQNFELLDSKRNGNGHAILPNGVVDPTSVLDSSTFEKYFKNIKIKPDKFFEKVIKEVDDTEEEKDLESILRGVIVSPMKVLKKKDPFTSYAALVVPPVVSKDLHLKVECNNTEYKDENQNILGYNGIVHIDISTSDEKIKGCDFSTDNSSILTTSIELVNGETKDCEININNNEFFGIICDNDTNLDPEKCFNEIYDKDKSNVKKFHELIPNIDIFSLPNSNKKKVAYAKIPLDYINKLSFSCSCKSSHNNTIGNMKVILNKDEKEEDEFKTSLSIKHNNVNLCNFFDNAELTFDNNKIILCKIDAELFSEVIIQLPLFGNNKILEGVQNEEYKKFSLKPLLPINEDDNDIKVIGKEKTEVSINLALKGVYGNRTFKFEKDGKKGEGISFFIPPTKVDTDLKFIINETIDNSNIKQRGLIYIFVRKNVKENAFKLCDFTTGSTSLMELNSQMKEKKCNVKIKKGDIFGIKCPKGFAIFPQACFSNVLLEYYKSDNTDSEDINYYIHKDKKYNLKPKYVIELMDENFRELQNIQQYTGISNITDMLHFTNYNLGNLPLNYKNNYSTAYAKVPDTFNSIINFSCNCYNPEKHVYGTMQVESDNRNFDNIKKNENIKKNVLLPTIEKFPLLLDDEQREKLKLKLKDTNDMLNTNNINHTNDINNIYMLYNSNEHICDYQKNESLISNISSDTQKIQKSTCKINAKALDVVTIKCPHTKNFTPKDLLDNSALHSNDKKIVITFDKKNFVTYIDPTKKTFSLKDIYIQSFYGVTLDHLNKIKKLQQEWDDEHLFYPPYNVLHNVVVNNHIVKLSSALEGVLFIKSKVTGDETSTKKNTTLPTDGVSSILIPPYVKEDITFHIFCGKSTTKKPNKNNTSLALIHIHIASNRNIIHGCDFIYLEKNTTVGSTLNNTSPIFTYNKNTENNLICDISLVPQNIIGINCPNKKMNPSTCFDEVYYIKEEDVPPKSITADKYNTFTKDKITNILKNAISITNPDEKDNTYSYLILPEKFEEELIDSKKVLACTCDNKYIIHMKIEKNTIEKIKNDEKKTIGKDICKYDVTTKVATCDIIDVIDSSSIKEHHTVNYSVTLSRWDKLIIKYPTNEKTHFEKLFVNPSNLKDKVLYNYTNPINIEHILPGSITTDLYDTRTKLKQYILRIPPYVHKDIHFSLQFNNTLSSTKQNQNVIYGNVANIFIHINQGYKEIHGCDFTGKYSHLFTYSKKPLPNDNDTCNITITNNTFSGFACLSHFELKPDNCFSSVYDNNEANKVKKLFDLSTNVELDHIKQNISGFTLSYIIFKKESNKLKFSCTCSSHYSNYTIRITFDPNYITPEPQSRAIIKYVDLKDKNFGKYLRKQ